MKKFMRVLIVVFVLGVAGAVSLGMVDFAGEEVRAVEEFPEEAIQDIEVEATSMDVEVQSSDSDQIAVTFEGTTRGNDEPYYRVDREGETLKIEQIPRNQFSFFPFFAGDDANLRIAIPERMFDHFALETTSGDMTISKVQAGEAHINSTSGSIELKESTIEDRLSLETTSGDVYGSSNTIQNASYQTTSGSISDQSPQGETFDYRTTSGDLEVKRSQVARNTNIQTNSGDVSFLHSSSPESLAVEFSSNSGEAVVDAEGMVYETKTEHSFLGKTGENDVRQLNVRTQSGDFHLEKE
ncbi:DUF4097 family beta strand repeat-containing protein [Salimicrobium halophilum]|uniref:DUF4097 and DUF4098 domain-containing protein YvlB n=1 Tax=Salimicrobium halophilum TaxID=86666 RepID=A0A1G8RFX7_9BACI|nr:DUF4097 family beta strand repeat-containing protein [Salimicrobium halophilum]SDJ15862.1 DUF4097 and DUF4098 domain-containing protein YvlB [Salimicrobium halophilum]